MRNRGNVFWEWADPSIHTRSVDERQPDGTLLNIQVRMSVLGRTELFIGVYEADGQMIFEDAPDSIDGETMTKAIARGLDIARQMSPLAAPAITVTATQKLPRTRAKRPPKI